MAKTVIDVKSVARFPHLIEDCGDGKYSSNDQERHKLETLYYLYIIWAPGTPKGHVHTKSGSTQRETHSKTKLLLDPECCPSSFSKGAFEWER